MLWNSEDPESFPAEAFLYAVMLVGELRRRALVWKIKPDSVDIEEYRQMFKEHLWSTEAKDSDREAFVATMEMVYKWIKHNPKKSATALALSHYRIAEWAQSNQEMLGIMLAMKKELPPVVLSWFIAVGCECFAILSTDDMPFEILSKEDPSPEIQKKITAFCKAYSEVKVALCIF